MRLIFLISFFIFSTNLFSQFSVGFEADTTLGCDSLSVQFTDTSIVNGFQSRLWEFGDGTTDTNISVVHVFDTVGVFNVKLTVYNQITGASVEKQIIVRKKPEAIIYAGKFPTYTINDTLYFSDKEILHESKSVIDSLSYIYSWIIDNDTMPDTTSSIVHYYENDGTYNCFLTVTAFDRCFDTTSAIITIEEKDGIPNIFTPNGDGKNDIFIIKTDGKSVYEFTVFSRYGTVVYKQKAKKIWWDGRTSAGQEVSPGTYFYILVPETGEAVKGTVFLNR